MEAGERVTSRGATRFAFPIFVLFLSLATGLGAGETQQSRTDHVLYSMPPGWKRVEKEGSTCLVPPNLPVGKMAELRIDRMRPLAGSLEASVNAEVRELQTKFANVQPLPVTTLHHRSGFDIGMGGASMETAPNSGQFLYAVMYLCRADDQVQPIYFVTNDQPLYMASRDAINRFMETMRLSDLIVLAEGKPPQTPPLTQAKLDQVMDFIEWLIEVPFTEDQRQAITAHAVASWKKNDREEIDGVDEVLKIRAQLAQMTKEQKALARQAAQPEAVKQWRTETDAMAKLMVQIYDDAHRPIAPGDPPLTRQAADATLEIMFFMACQVNGQGDVPVTQQMKDQCAKALAENYAKLNPPDRQRIAQMPMAWAALRVTWPELPEAERAKLRAQWAQTEDVKAVAAELAKARQEAEKSSESASAIMDKHTRDYNTTMSLMNTSMNCYRTQMSAISSVGSAGWRYEYRYR